jgi:hypothetical protein
MERLFDLLVEIRTPLAMAGGGLALVLATFLQVLKRRHIGGQTIVMLMRYVFVLGFAALVLGFAGYMIPAFMPSEASISGVVLDGHGNLVDQASVSVGGMPEINDQTGTNGNFRIFVPADKRRTSYKVFAKKGKAIGVSAVHDHFDDVTVLIADADPDATAHEKAVIDAGARQQPVADAEARRLAAADAEARRQAVADAEARGQAAADAEARRQAVADAEARGQAAADAEARRQAAADAEARRQAAEEAKQKAAADAAEARRQAKGASITLINPGGCGLALSIKIGDKQFHPLSNPAILKGAQLGDQEYNVSGTVQCSGAWCYAYGSGSIDIEDGSTYTIDVVNNLPGKCEVTFD